MMRLFCPFLTLLLMCSSLEVHAQAPPLPWTDAAPAPELPSAMAQRVMPPVIVALPGMERVRYIRDLSYSRSPDPLLRLDIYRPPDGDETARPVVLFVHGGTDAKGGTKDWGIYQSWGRLAAASGFVGVTFTHRLGFTQPRLEAAAEDLASALQFIRDNARHYGIDPARICVAAYSAGGPLLADYLVEAPAGIRCLVAWYPFMDVRQSSFHRKAETVAVRNRFSNILRIKQEGRRTPLLLIRAGRDEVPTLLDSVDRFAAAALRLDYPLTLVNHPLAPHGFDNQLNDERACEIIMMTLSFMRHHLESYPRQLAEQRTAVC